MSSPASTTENTSDIEKYMMEMYQKHNPSKLGDIPQLILKYKGRETELRAKMENKYSSMSPTKGSGPQSPLLSPFASPASKNESNSPLSTKAPAPPLSTKAPVPPMATKAPAPPMATKAPSTFGSGSANKVEAMKGKDSPNTITDKEKEVASTVKTTEEVTPAAVSTPSSGFKFGTGTKPQTSPVSTFSFGSVSPAATKVPAFGSTGTAKVVSFGSPGTAKAVSFGSGSPAATSGSPFGTPATSGTPASSSASPSSGFSFGKSSTTSPALSFSSPAKAKGLESPTPTFSFGSKMSNPSSGFAASAKSTTTTASPVSVPPVSTVTPSSTLGEGINVVTANKPVADPKAALTPFGDIPIAKRAVPKKVSLPVPPVSLVAPSMSLGKEVSSTLDEMFQSVSIEKEAPKKEAAFSTATEVAEVANEGDANEDVSLPANPLTEKLEDLAYALESGLVTDAEVENLRKDLFKSFVTTGWQLP